MITMMMTMTMTMVIIIMTMMIIIRRLAPWSHAFVPLYLAFMIIC